MALVLKKLYHGYFWVFDELSDRRTDNIFIVSSPLYFFLIEAIYIYVVKVLGPKFMEKREPYNIKNILLVYNAIQVVLNTHLFVSLISFMFIENYGMDCSSLSYESTPSEMFALSAAYKFFLLKLLDLVDTVFFVLRKSYRQISFLHVYHHSAMVFCMWVGIRFFSGGTGIWLVLVNSFIHALMFSYYFLTAMDSSWKNSIGLKKALTQIQLIQFTIFILVFGRTLVDPSCGYPKLAAYLFVPQNFFMLFLFGDFYLKTYVYPKRKTKAT